MDEYGTIYFKNDSAYLMAVGSTIERIEVTKLPDKTTYKVKDTFDPTGMQVTAYYANGKTRDITAYSISSHGSNSISSQVRPYGTPPEV